MLYIAHILLSLSLLLHVMEKKQYKQTLHRDGNENLILYVSDSICLREIWLCIGMCELFSAVSGVDGLAVTGKD